MTAMDVNIGVAIVQWNHSALTISLLEDLLTCKANLHVAICDNGSDLDHQSALVDYLSKLGATGNLAQSIRLLQNKNNSGYARGTNVCIRSLLNSGCEWIWLLNNDTRISEAMSLQLTRGIVGLKPGIYGVNLQQGNSETIVGGYRYDFWSTRNFPLNSQEAFDDIDNLKKFISGASMIVHRDVFIEVGLLNEDHFLYFEELDFVYRAHKAGYKQKIILGVEVYHHGEGSSGESGQARKLIYHETWSMLNFHLQHKKRLLPWIVLVRNPIRYLRLLTTHRAQSAPGVIRAMVDFFYKKNVDEKPVLVIETTDY